jgi:hypothetical protein
MDHLGEEQIGHHWRYFGTIAVVRGFGSDKALKLPDGRTVFFDTTALHLVSQPLASNNRCALRSPRPK